MATKYLNITELGLPVYQVTRANLETVDVVKAEDLEAILADLLETEDWKIQERHEAILPDAL